MNMIVGKKQLVLASLVVALGVAVYLNYQFAGEDLDLVTANAQQTTQELLADGATVKSLGKLNQVAGVLLSHIRTEDRKLAKHLKGA